MLPNGYLSVAQAVAACELQSSWHRNIDEFDLSPFCGKNKTTPPKLILEKALASGELFAALMRAKDGVLVVVPASSWRREHHDPSRFWDTKHQNDPPNRPFIFAELGHDIPAQVDVDGNLTDWGTAIIADLDLAVWSKAGSLPQAPTERPANWPMTPEPPRQDLAETELRLFLQGYALGSIMQRYTPTRDDHRRIAAQEFDATNAQADAVYAQLPKRLKNADRSKGKTALK